MAFYGSLGEVNYGALDASITDTAVDIFVYDTSKDSDGGAWRHRTQHTSWYNETLNTATRGSRREFPAVAVIVAESSKITIYDGDDPDMPMWMVIDQNVRTGSSAAHYATGYFEGVRAFRSVNALNSILSFCCGTDGSTGAYSWLMYYSFVDDKIRRYNGGGPTGYGRYCGDFIYDIARRHQSSTVTYEGFIYNGNYRIAGSDSVASTPVDVSMTVLPNAPIDSTTGLPVPTIAVATASGVSVIKDDGTVVDLRLINTYGVQFTDDYKLVANINTNNTTFSTHIYDVISSSDSNTNGNRVYYRDAVGGRSTPPLSGNNVEGTANETRVLKDNLIAIPCAGNAGGTIPALNILQDNSTSQSNAMVAYITSNYNTGWMHGDIKGAFLADTNATNITGSNLIDNGDFGTGNFTNWNIGGDTTPTIDSGGAKLTTAAAIDGYIWQSTSGEATSGKWIIGWTLTANTSGFVGLFINGTQPASGSSYSTGATLVRDGITSSGSYTYQGNITSVEFRHRGGGGGYAIVDNITLVRLGDEDRSVNNKGLQVFGTVTKSAVATGAELVAYSGWSTSNYLQQPYNSALDFGTGNFYVMGWVKSTGGSVGYVWEKAQTLVASSYTEMYWHNTNVLYFHVNGGTPATQSVTPNVWNHFVCVRNGGVQSLYVNGVKGTDSNNAGNVSNSNSQFRVGIRAYDVASPFNGSISLVRIGSGAPSAEQIKKIYEDEKVLFQENAACTLYGSSDTVTALAYDDFNDLLHVGTSSGRSDFQGLRRINNTTTAVSTAISASNGLIAEQ